jgi:hypothetical protein
MSEAQQARRRLPCQAACQISCMNALLDQWHQLDMKMCDVACMVSLPPASLTMH